MDDGQDVRAALGGLALHAEPAPGFDTDDVVRAGRRTRRRRRGFLAAGGTSLAIAVVVAGAVVVIPDRTGGGGQRAGGGAPSGTVTGSPAGTRPTPAPPPVGRTTVNPPGSSRPVPGGGPTGSCTGEPTDADWAIHLRYDNTLRGLLPSVSGMLTDVTPREPLCDRSPDWRLAMLKVTDGRSAGLISSGVATAPGQYELWQHGNQCDLGPTRGTCSFTRRDGAIVWAFFRPDGYSQDEGDEGDENHVIVTFPDDTVVSVTAASRYFHDVPVLSAAPVALSQLVEIALDPALRSVAH